MRKEHLFTLLFLVSLAAATGCWDAADPETDPVAPLNWVESGIDHHGATIKLGFRHAAPGDDRSVEPVAEITRDGAPVAGAMVFVSFSPQAEEAAGDEVPTLYQPPAQYTSGKMGLPDKAGKTVVRFRIVLPDDEQNFTREIPLP